MTPLQFSAPQVSTQTGGTAGNGTITAGSTSVNITHALSVTPDEVIITPTSDTLGKRLYVSAKGGTTFTVTIDSTAGSNITFDWFANKPLAAVFAPPASDGTAGTPTLRTLGTGSQQSAAGNDSRLSDDRTASGLRTATTVVVVSGATAPTTGQVLTATGASAANWQTPAAGGSVSDATTGSKGIIQLAGDLAGTAASPTVPGLATKATDTAVVHIAGTETVAGSKNFTGGITKSGNAVVDTTDSRLSDTRTPTDATVTDAKISGTLSASKITGTALVSTNNLSDLGNVTTTRTNLGLGNAATKSVGTTTGTVAAGDDSRLSDSRTPTGAAGGLLAGNYPSPTLDYTNAAVSIKAPAKVAMVSNVTVSNPGTSTFDGITLSVSDRLLLTFQTTGSENGLYIFNGSGVALTRSTDADTSAKYIPGFIISITSGTNVGLWRFTNATTPTLGTTTLSFDTTGAYASTTIRGAAKLSTAAATATNPIVVGDNDARVPTQGENDALVGTSGTASSSNKYVTDSDARNTNSRTPTGTAAGGFLSGTYPNPSYDTTYVGIPEKQKVRVAMLANVTVSNPGTSIFDGLTITTGDRVLLAGQTNAAENGIYIFQGSGSAMTRATDADTAAELFGGFAVTAVEGIFNNGPYLHSTTAAITLGTTSIVFRPWDATAHLEATPEDHGLLAWSHDPISTTATSIAPTSGQLQLMKVKWPRTNTITGVSFVVDAAGTSFTSNQSFGGVYDKGGNLLQSSANGVMDTSAGTSGYRTCALASTVTPVGGRGIWLWIGILIRTGTQANMPTLARVNPPNAAMGNANLTGSNGRYMQAGNQTTLPASLSLPVTLNTQYFWAALY